MKIGIFDSGVGGESVVSDTKIRFPEAEIIFLDDKDNLPYGNKTNDQLIGLMSPILDRFNRSEIDALVIACNTVSTNIQGYVRARSNAPALFFVPMIKSAAQITRTGRVTVCATPATLASSRYKELISKFGSSLEVFEPDCSNWASMIEKDELCDRELQGIVDSSIRFGSDVIVLGCTHYHWIESRLKKLAEPSARVIQPTDSVMEELSRVLQQQS